MKNKKQIISFAKERTLNAIKIDRSQFANAVIEVPLQPYMEYMMDVTSEALGTSANHTNTINIQNKNTGLRFAITKIEDDSFTNDHYAIKLFNGNEIRFSGTVLNRSSHGRNDWYFTEKYEDAVSATDISRFIEATAILRAKLFTEQSDSLEKLMQWTLVCMAENARQYKFDADTKILRTEHDDITDLTLEMGGITIAECTLCIDDNGMPQVLHMQEFHNVPVPVLIKLGSTMQQTVRDKFKNSDIVRIQALQDKFNQSHAGVHYNEQAKLNDLFKQYV